MRNFVSYWEEHRKELGNGQPFEKINGELFSIFDQETIKKVTPFAEGILLDTDLKNKEGALISQKVFVPWHQVATIIFP